MSYPEGASGSSVMSMTQNSLLRDLFSKKWLSPSRKYLKALSGAYLSPCLPELGKAISPAYSVHG